MKGKGSIGFDPAGAFFVFAVPTAEAGVANIDALSGYFENTTFLGGANLRDCRCGHIAAVRSVASAVQDGESALLVIVRFNLETEGLPGLFKQAASVMAGQLCRSISRADILKRSRNA